MWKPYWTRAWVLLHLNETQIACREVHGNETLRSIPMERRHRNRWMVQLVLEGQDKMDL